MIPRIFESCKRVDVSGSLSDFVCFLGVLHLVPLFLGLVWPLESVSTSTLPLAGLCGLFCLCKVGFFMSQLVVGPCDSEL